MLAASDENSLPVAATAMTAARIAVGLTAATVAPWSGRALARRAVVTWGALSRRAVAWALADYWRRDS